MATEKEWPIGVAVVIACLLFFVGLATVSKDEVRKESVHEAERIELELGHTTLMKISARADAWYLATLGKWDKNTLRDWMADDPVQIQREKRQAKYAQEEKSKAKDWLNDRRQAFLDLGYWILRRIALFQMFIPLWLPLGILAVYHGWMSRAIKQTDFGYTSPVVNHWARSFMTFITVLTILLFFSPVALYPVIFPTLMAFWSVATAAAIGNIQKRI